MVTSHIAAYKPLPTTTHQITIKTWAATVYPVQDRSIFLILLHSTNITISSLPIILRQNHHHLSTWTTLVVDNSGYLKAR